MAPAQKPGRSEQVVQTPEVFLTAVKRLLGIKDWFWLDAAADADNAVGRHFLTAQDDALTRRWLDVDPADAIGRWAWCNPPFGRLDQWTEHVKAQALFDGLRIAMLVPASTGTNWWRDHVDGEAEVLLLNGRITFEGHTTAYPKDCALLLYAPDRWPGYHVWNWRAAAEPARKGVLR